jgi:hypothetical protein
MWYATGTAVRERASQRRYRNVHAKAKKANP